MLPYHQFGQDKIFSAFGRLFEAIKDCKGMDIQLTNDITYSPGAYAWLKCASGVQCADELKQLAGIEGTAGVNYGATNNSKYIRIRSYCINGVIIMLYRQLGICTFLEIAHFALEHFSKY